MKRTWAGLIKSSDLPYVASAEHYDGVSDYAQSAVSTPGTGQTNGVVMSAWLKLESLATFPLPVTTLLKFTSPPPVQCYAGFACEDDGTGPYAWFLIDAVDGSNNAVRILGARDLPSDWADRWVHVLMGINCQNGSYQIYIDDVDPGTHAGWPGAPGGGPVPGQAAATMDWSKIQGLGIGQGYIDAPVFQLVQGCCSELFMAGVDVLPDFSVVANRRKFIDADGKPVFLGARGEIPLAAIPIFYSPKGDGHNLGSGGGLDTFGAPTTCTTSP